jgi:PIN domain nuclease of toxin-antitoxin system
MNIILDTHIILWWLEDNPRLKNSFKNAIADKRNLCFISAASVWEISIKKALGKLDIPSNYLSVLKKQGFGELPITWEHSQKILSLPMKHKDPFDRMLIAQCIAGGFTILTADGIFAEYKIKMLK